MDDPFLKENTLLSGSDKNLSESERYYRTLIHSLHENLLVIDRDFRVTDINNTALKTLGKTRQEVIGRFCYEITYNLNEPCDEHNLPCPLQKVFDTGEPINCRHEHVTSKGTMVHIDILASPIKDSKGNVTHIIKAVRDISDQLEAQEALGKNEAFLNTLLDAIQIPVFYKDKDGRYLGCNTAFETYFGVTKKRLIGKTVFDINPPEFAKIHYAKDTELFVNGGMQQYESQVKNTHGVLRDVIFNKAVFTDTQGAISGLVGAILDITERKHNIAINSARFNLMQFAATHSLDELLEETLKEAEKLTNSRIGFYHFVEDDQKSLTLQNWSTRTKAEFCKVKGKGLHYAITDAGVWVDCVYQQKPVIHNDFASLPHRKGMPQGHAEVIRELVIPVLRGKKIKAILGVGNKPTDYTEKDVEAISLLADLAWEITERKQAEETLRKNEERYRELYERSPLGYQSLDADGCFINVNQAWLDMLGYTHDEVISQWCGNFLAPHQVELFRERFPLFKAAGEVNAEFQMKHKNGSIITVAADGKIGYDEKGNFKQTHCILHDITERKKVEQEIRKLTEELEQRVVKRTAQLEAVNQELEAFAYSVSHDLRAPLRHIDGFIGLLQKRMETTLDEKSRHYMDMISASTKRMDMLIRDLLSFSRMGSYKMSKRSVDMGILVQEIIQEFETEIGNRDINWRVDDLPVVTGDRAMLHMVLVNLISNALKFTQPRQSAEIEIGWMSDKKTETIIFVRDNGVGFDMNYADKLFGVFQRLHRADEFEGTGIGLANVRRIISRHGGRTWAEGKVDKGATFYFSLPYNNVRSFERSG